MSFVNLAVVTALCLQLPVTRIYSVIGVGILLYFRPVLSLVLFQSDNGGYYGHGTHEKNTERNNTHLNNIFVSFRGFRGY